MKQYRQITLEEAAHKPLCDIIHDFNDAIEMIWHLFNEVEELMKENDDYCEAYDKLLDEIHG